ncbi:hypothetical protein BpHYR1_049292 [Brachionus plicatilis]|uniref:Uncharacterized protein n=1 Tax=Brachionus plicatilis TaxID=10195 RepID=A0A3M7P660_BRAPC|nr:hypothetical protein BpHYR1_049292 [Brachionus plicatilis]
MPGFCRIGDRLIALLRYFQNRNRPRSAPIHHMNQPQDDSHPALVFSFCKEKELKIRNLLDCLANKSLVPRQIEFNSQNKV